MSPTFVVPDGTGTVGSESPLKGVPAITTEAWTMKLPGAVGTLDSVNVPSPMEVVVKLPTETVAPETGTGPPLITRTTRPVTVVSGSGMTLTVTFAAVPTF